MSLGLLLVGSTKIPHIRALICRWDRWLKLKILELVFVAEGEWQLPPQPNLEQLDMRN